MRAELESTGMTTKRSARALRDEDEREDRVSSMKKTFEGKKKKF